MTWTLSEAQQNAIDSDVPKMCILACAGSGKTTTLTRRIARLINEGEAEANQVKSLQSPSLFSPPTNFVRN